ncbi:MAG: hypothetical protein EBU26_15645 [Verrucomicrobia bacterium]|nr:hypothetical protein [Verrucomicrobiota bacterium]
MSALGREKILVTLAVAAVAILFGDKVILGPLSATWKERRDRIEILDQQVLRGQALMDRESAIRRKWLEMWQAAIPRDRSVSENQVLESVDRWASASRISFTSIKPSWRTADDGHLLLECRANGYGDLSEIIQFVHALESDDLALQVNLLELTQRDDKGSSIGMNLNFSGLLLPEALK